MGPLGTMLLLYCFELVLVTEIEIIFRRPLGTEAALQRCSYKKVSKNMKQIYRRTPLPKCDLQSNFIEITFPRRCFPVNLLHIFRAAF